MITIFIGPVKLPAAIYLASLSFARTAGLISYSYPKENSRRVLVRLEGRDGIFFQKLASTLGSKKRAQNAIILEGYIEKIRQSSQVSHADIERVEKLWPKVVGMSRSEFVKIISSIA
jgi:hypothetical protein